MKSLLVLRHGKSDWSGVDDAGRHADHDVDLDVDHDAGHEVDHDVGVDHDRPLKRRGMESARLMGRYLSASGNEPDLVLTSSAVRARKTAELAAKAGDWSCPVEVVRELYGATPQGVLDVVRAQTSPERLLVVGHEPTLSELVGELLGGVGLRFPTGALACIDFVGDAWEQVGPGTGTLQWLVVPRALQAFAGKA